MNLWNRQAGRPRGTDSASPRFPFTSRADEEPCVTVMKHDERDGSAGEAADSPQVLAASKDDGTCNRMTKDYESSPTRTRT
jgi:hypothetical protein